MQAQERQFAVVMNAEHQYSVWSAHQPLPGGWQATGFIGTREQCLEHIGTQWHDMREHSLQVALACTEATRG
jgi:MbtH protein